MGNGIHANDVCRIDRRVRVRLAEIASARVQYLELTQPDEIGIYFYRSSRPFYITVVQHGLGF